MEETKTNLENLEDKFTKANMYAALNELAGDEESDLTLELLLIAVKPQKGGGASSNPAIEIDGVLNHWCRYKGEYVPEEFMNMSNGKSKGTSIIASKVAYRIERASKLLNAEALSLFTSGDYANGASVNAEADALLKTIENEATFTDEAMAISEYHPDFGKKEIAVESAII